MSEYLDNQVPSIQEIDDEAPVQYFCKFTFAQFFTIMVLAVFTLGFMFYLGARYGNDYLRLGETASSSANSINSVGISTIPGSGSIPTDPEKTEEMLKAARDVLQQQQTEKFQEQAAAVMQNPAAYQQQLNQQPANPQPSSAQDQPVAQVPTTVAQTAGQRINEYETPQALPQPRPIPQQPTADDVPAQPVEKSAAGTTFSVQVGASQNMDEANQWVQQWRDRGYSAFMMAADLHEKGRWFRVRLGSFPSRTTAEAFAGQLKTKEQVDAIAVQNE